MIDDHRTIIRKQIAYESTDVIIFSLYYLQATLYRQFTFTK